MKQPYFLEKSLLPRVAKYMDENKEVDVDHMARYLMENYREFRNKKQKRFIESVFKAYKWELYCRERDGIIDASEDSSEVEIDDDDGGGPDILEITPKKQAQKKKETNGVLSPPPSGRWKPPVQFVDIVESTTKPKPNMQKGRTSTGTPCREQEVVESRTKNKTSKDRTSAEVEQSPAVKRLKTGESSASPVITGTPTRTKKLKMEIPSVKFSDMAGIDPIRKDILKISRALHYTLPSTKVWKHSTIISGPEGSGKTMLAKAIAAASQVNLIHFNADELLEGSGADGEKRLREVFRQALSTNCCILLLDKLNVLSQKETHSGRNLERRLCRQVARHIEELKEHYPEKRVIVLAEVQHAVDIDWALRSAFQAEVSMPTLDTKAKEEILRLTCPNLGLDIAKIAQNTAGFVAGDLVKLGIEAYERALDRKLMPGVEWIESFDEQHKRLTQEWASAKVGEDPLVKQHDFNEALSVVVPALKRQGFPCIPDVTWEDVGGLEDVKNELKEKILNPIKFPECHERYNVTRPTGILLWGPPGCGKTLVAKALAREAGLNFIAVRGPEILCMYQGESERKIREIFSRAKSVAPCIIFFDEFDAICPTRSKGNDSGSKQSVVAQLLVELDGFTSREKVYVLGATNRPDNLDLAVRRPGRFDTHLYIGMPDKISRVSIFKACSRGGTCPRFAPDICLEKFAENLEGFSGADCAQLLYLASLAAIKEDIANESSPECMETDQGSVQGAEGLTSTSKIDPPNSQLTTSIIRNEDKTLAHEDSLPISANSKSTLLCNSRGFHHIENGSNSTPNTVGISNVSSTSVYCTDKACARFANISSNTFHTCSLGAQDLSELSDTERVSRVASDSGTVFLRHMQIALRRITPSVSNKALKWYLGLKKQLHKERYIEDDQLESSQIESSCTGSESFVSPNSLIKA